MSYTQLLYHAVVRTYKSEHTLPTDDRRKFLYQEIWGIIHSKGGHLYRINSMSDHAHLLFTMPPTIALSDFMKAIKASSSKIIKTKCVVPAGLYWCAYSLLRRLKPTVNSVSSLRDYAEK